MGTKLNLSCFVVEDVVLWVSDVAYFSRCAFGVLFLLRPDLITLLGFYIHCIELGIGYHCKERKGDVCRLVCVPWRSPATFTNINGEI